MRAALDLATLIRPEDLVVCGQGCAEPTTLLEMLVAQGDAIGPFRLFLGASYSGAASVSALPGAQLCSYAALGTTELVRAGRLEIWPDHYSNLSARFADGRLAADVVLLQAAPPDRDGRMSLGLGADYPLEAARRARAVVLEVNARVPWTYGEPLENLRVAAVLHTDREPVTPPPARPPNAAARRIGARIAERIPDGATLELGVGSIAEATLAALAGHRDLGIHSGLFSDGMAELARKGVITNALKAMDRGVSVAAVCYGGAVVRDFVRGNPAVALRSSAYTHSPDILFRQEKLHAINFALEVDLTGQVNAEAVDGDYLGGVGGHADFSRAAHRMADGRAIVALASASSDGRRSRIVVRLSGPATTPRSDVDLVVTEWGAAELAGQSIAERQRRMIAIAHPDHREALTAAAAGLRA
jgi:acetyl-CoA hydrolase